MDDSIQFRTHDNVDRDLIRINKDKLILEFDRGIDAATASRAIAPYGGLALTLFSAVFLTEKFHGISVVSGDTIRSAFLLGGIAMSVLTMYNVYQWWCSKGQNTAEAIVEKLAPSVTKSIPPLMLPAPQQTQEKKRSVRTPRGMSNKIPIQSK